LNFTNNLLNEGLHSRAITRDIKWGIPVPVEGYEDKRIYVWFDAVIGYLSASIEWAKNHGQPEAWHKWWDEDSDVAAYYFIGKDNIFFHTLIWPAMLMGYGGLQLPYDVPANEFLTLEGRKLSSSRNWAVWAPDYLSRYDADPIRYYLTVQAPESSDGDFSWQEFLDRNNNELVGTWGNLAHRMLTFAYKNFDGTVPEPGELGKEEQALIDEVNSAFEPVAEAIEACRFRWAVGRVMAAARAANRYLDTAAPWKSLKSDPVKAATATYTALRVIDSLKVLFAPFVPFSSEKLNCYLGYEEPMFGEQQETTVQESERSHLALTYEGAHDVDVWKPSDLQPGQTLQRPKPLFRKLDEEIVEQERARLG